MEKLGTVDDPEEIGWTRKRRAAMPGERAETRWKRDQIMTAKIELCVIRQIFDFKYLRSDKLCARFHRLGTDKNGQILPVL